MPHHVIIDGSNLATEGRTMPSLKQLNEAIKSYRADHPEALVTVVVDATFGHRIDTKEVAEFEKAIETNELVAPPAGAVGRGDGFVLSIAQKAHASVLSNDSYQEFHGEYPWLFDEGRLIGGKPVPHVGWVFVDRVPVRGPVSRRSVKEQKVVEKNPGRGRGRARSTASLSADGPMPVPKAPPPGAVMPGGRVERSEPRQQQPKASEPKSAAPKSTNDLLAFLSFVEHFPVGTAVTAVVESYSSHGAYVSIGEVKGYVPLRLMADPAPRSAREAMEIGETVTLVVASFAAARRSIDLALPSMAPTPPPPAEAKPRRAAARKAVVSELTTGAPPIDEAPPAAVPKKVTRGAKKAARTDTSQDGETGRGRSKDADRDRSKRRGSDGETATVTPVLHEELTSVSSETVASKAEPKRSPGATKRQVAKATATKAAPTPSATAAAMQRTAKQSAKRAGGQTAKKKPDDSTENIPQTSPDRSTQKAPDKATQKAPDKATQKSPDKATQKSAGKAMDKSSQKSTEKKAASARRRSSKSTED